MKVNTNKICVCPEPKPSGLWEVGRSLSRAECECGGWYATTLLLSKGARMLLKSVSLNDDGEITLRGNTPKKIIIDDKI